MTIRFDKNGNITKDTQYPEIDITIPAEVIREQKLKELTSKRDKELQKLTILNISCTESNMFKIAVKFNIMKDTDTANWIDIDNQQVSFSKGEFGMLIAQGTAKIEEIYFRYRQLKNRVLVV